MTGSSRREPDVLADVAGVVERCNRCGTCLAACPTYAVRGTESTAARGRVQLAAGILRGDMAADRESAAIFASCTTCMACEPLCPSGVPVARIVDAARAAVVREKGLPWVKAALFGAVKRPRMLRAAAAASARLQDVAFEGHGDDLRRLRIPYGLAARRAYPPLAARPFEMDARAAHGDDAAGAGTGGRAAGANVLFFAGCMVTYVYPEIGHAAVRLLRRAGATVVAPSVSACCGTPLEAHGDAAGARQLARLQLDQLEDVSFDVLVSACPTCSGSFSHRYPRLLADEPRYAALAESVAVRTRDVTQYLADFAAAGSTALDARITYHDPCHLVRGAGVADEPRRLLAAIPGVQLVEMEQPARCCGGAGSFSLTHPELSMAIGALKAEDVRSTGAEVVATACPGCRMQLADVLQSAGAGRPVVHVVQLLDAAAQA